MALHEFFLSFLSPESEVVVVGGMNDVDGGVGCRNHSSAIPLLVREKYNVGSNFGYHAVTSPRFWSASYTQAACSLLCLLAATNLCGNDTSLPHPLLQPPGKGTAVIRDAHQARYDVAANRDILITAFAGEEEEEEEGKMSGKFCVGM